MTLPHVEPGNALRLATRRARAAARGTLSGDPPAPADSAGQVLGTQQPAGASFDGAPVPGAGKGAGKQFNCPGGLRTAHLGRVIDYTEQRHQARQLAIALGGALQTQYLFTHFVTVTLRDKTLPDGSTVLLGRQSIQRAWRYFCGQARHLGGTYPAAFVCTEYQRRGVPHIHALTVNTCGLIGRERELQQAMWERYGRTLVSRYDPGRGAAGYLSKYIASDSAVDFQVTGQLHQYGAPVRECADLTPCAADHDQGH